MQVKGFVDTRVQYDGQELSMRSQVRSLSLLRAVPSVVEETRGPASCALCPHCLQCVPVTTSSVKKKRRTGDIPILPPCVQVNVNNRFGWLRGKQM